MIRLEREESKVTPIDERCEVFKMVTRVDVFLLVFGVIAYLFIWQVVSYRLVNLNGCLFGFAYWIWFLFDSQHRSSFLLFLINSSIFIKKHCKDCKD